MAKKHGGAVPNLPKAPSQDAHPELSAYWKEQIQRLGRRLSFVDTGAILGCMDKDVTDFPAFFDELVGQTLVTSTFVVTETVRRIVKAKIATFAGPGGEHGTDLALHILKEWLTEHGVVVINVTDPVFEAAKRSFEKYRGINCDLNDMVSYEMVQGLQQTTIITTDSHFKSLGLDVLPG